MSVIFCFTALLQLLGQPTSEESAMDALLAKAALVPGSPI